MVAALSDLSNLCSWFVSSAVFEAVAFNLWSDIIQLEKVI